MKDTANARWTTADLDEAGRIAFTKLFPQWYRTVYSTAQAVPASTFVPTPAGQTAEHVYDVEDASQVIPTSIGFPGRRGTAIGPVTAATSVVIVSIEPLRFPDGAVVTSEVVPEEAMTALWLLAQVALVDMILAQLTDFQKYQPTEPDATDENELIQMADTWQARADRELRDSVGMALPSTRLV